MTWVARGARVIEFAAAFTVSIAMNSCHSVGSRSGSFAAPESHGFQTTVVLEPVLATVTRRLLPVSCRTHVAAVFKYTRSVGAVIVIGPCCTLDWKLSFLSR